MIFTQRPFDNDVESEKKRNFLKGPNTPSQNHITISGESKNVKVLDTKIEYEGHETGSAANCTLQLSGQDGSVFQDDDHPDSGTVTVYCRRIHYRTTADSFRKAGSVIVGVLSGAGGDGPSRRQVIRKTWAQYRVGVFFLVAGPWDAIAEEYEKNRDLVWIDEEEVYDGERSVLTYKTTSFISIVHITTKRLHKMYGFVFKTDDDSYLDIDKLYKEMYSTEHDPYDYWGFCRAKQPEALRGPDNKWSVSYETYPEPMYPKYCQGAGFAISRGFIECMAGQGSLSLARYMPFEDVAIGLQAERCGITPTMASDPEQLQMYRTNTGKERDKVNFNKGKVSEESLPKADMKGKILQHRIYNNHDMEEHYKAAKDPDYRRNHASEEKSESYY